MASDEELFREFQREGVLIMPRASTRPVTPLPVPIEEAPTREMQTVASDGAASPQLTSHLNARASEKVPTGKYGAIENGVSVSIDVVGTDSETIEPELERILLLTEEIKNRHRDKFYADAMAAWARRGQS
jgi:hypothetical protein